MAVFKAKAGSKFNNSQAQVIGERLTEKGMFKPEEVVTDATDEDSPLHPFFEWDDTEAARQHRISQARRMVASVQIVIKGPHEKERTRAVQSIDIKIEDKMQRRYIPMAVVVNSPEMADQVVDRALCELRGWKKRYEQYAELFTPVLQAIDSVEAKQKAS